MKNFVIALIAVSFFCSPVSAEEDTEENRKAAVERYSESMRVEDMMADMVNAMAMNLPLEKRDGFRSFMIDYVDYKRIEKSSEDIMVRYFTVEEINALTDFYSQPVAKSAMKKFGPYMAEVMPVIHAEMMRAMGEMQKSEAERNRKVDGQ